MENELTKQQADQIISLIEKGIFTQYYRENRGQRKGHFNESYDLEIKKGDIELGIVVSKVSYSEKSESDCCTRQFINHSVTYDLSLMKDCDGASQFYNIYLSITKEQEARIISAVERRLLEDGAVHQQTKEERDAECNESEEEDRKRDIDGITKLLKSFE